MTEPLPVNPNIYHVYMDMLTGEIGDRKDLAIMALNATEAQAFAGMTHLQRLAFFKGRRYFGDVAEATIREFSPLAYTSESDDEVICGAKVYVKRLSDALNTDGWVASKAALERGEGLRVPGCVLPEGHDGGHMLDQSLWEPPVPVPPSHAALTGDCSIDCQEHCQYPGEFSECDV